MQVLIALTATIGIAPCVAQAQGNDPGTGSPSGTIYEIPLDSARSDAAPRDRRGTANQPSPASPIHSENGFGSSARVPGAPATGPATRGSGSGSGSASGSEKRGRDAAQQPAGTVGDGAKGVVPNAETPIRPAARAAAPSSVRAYVLLGLAIGVAVALGAAARLAARRR